MSGWLKLAAVAGGGALGASLRYFISTSVDAVIGRGFPYGTMLVNVVGSLLIGYLIEWLPHPHEPAPYLRLMLITGLLGGFTTYSAFSVETLRLAQTGFMVRAGINIMFTLVFCLLAVWLGYLLGRQIHGTG